MESKNSGIRFPKAFIVFSDEMLKKSSKNLIGYRDFLSKVALHFQTDQMTLGFYCLNGSF